jgi:hypothetical protein
MNAAARATHLRTSRLRDGVSHHAVQCESPLLRSRYRKVLECQKNSFLRHPTISRHARMVIGRSSSAITNSGESKHCGDKSSRSLSRDDIISFGFSLAPIVSDCEVITVAAHGWHIGGGTPGEYENNGYQTVHRIHSFFNDIATISL